MATKLQYPCPFCPVAVSDLNLLSTHVNNKHEQRAKDAEAFAMTERNPNRLQSPVANG